MTREEAIKVLEECGDGGERLEEYLEAERLAIEALKQPEQKKGKWINCGIIYAGTAGYTIFRCSECNEPNYRRSRFCPNCGAEMEE